MHKLAWTTVGILGVAALAACGDDTEGAGGSGQGGAGGASTTTSTSSSDGGGGSTSDGGGGSTSDGGGGSTSDGGGGSGGEGGGSASSAWVRFANDADSEGVVDVVTTSDGGVVVLLAINGTTNLGGSDLSSAGSGDVAVARYAADGTHVWSKRLGGAGNDYPETIAIGANDEIYVTGFSGGSVDFGGGTLNSAGTDAFLFSLDANGGHRWSKLFGGSGNSDRGWAVSTSVSGLVVMTGMFDGTVDFGGGNIASTGLDGFVAAFDTAGAHAYSLRFDDGGSFPFAGGVAVDDDGNAYLSGYFQGTSSLGGLVSAGQQDIFLAKLDDTGALSWSKRFGSAGQEFGSFVALDGLGNVVQTGNLSGAADFGGGVLTTAAAGFADVFVARFDGDGNHLSSRRFGDASDQFVGGLRARADGAIVIGGWLTGGFTVDGVTITASGFSQDSFWIALDAANVALGGATYTGMTEPNKIAGVDFAPDESVYFGGDYASAIEVAGQTLTTSDFASAYWGRQPIAP